MFSDIRCCFLSWDRTVYANDDRNIYVLRQLFFDCFVGSYTSAVLFCQWFPLKVYEMGVAYRINQLINSRAL